MGVTSDRLRELTKRKLELIREIDKSPSNETLKENLRLIEEEISRERKVVVYGRPEEKRVEPKVPTTKEDKIEVKPNAASGIIGKGKEKNLKDFF